MTALVSAVFVASLLGSLHCAGMCGAFVAFAMGDGAGSRAARARLSVAYHGGRLITYIVLGVAAGSVGALLDLGGALAGISEAAMFLSGSVMVLFGFSAVMAVFGKRPIRMPVPDSMHKVLMMGQRAAMRFSPVRRAMAIGLLTTLLPCGWLYAFAAVAAGTSSPVLGGLTMAVFWAGTLPALVSLGAGVQRISGVLGNMLPHATSVMLIVAGAWTLVGRGGLDMHALLDEQPVFEDVREAASGLGALTEHAPACCEENE